MTGIERYESSALIAWAESARAAHGVAESLVKTSFVPEAFRNKAVEATAAILAGAEVGLSPMASLRSFDIIQGTAAPRAMTLRAVVQSAGHEMWVEQSTDDKAVVCGRRRGSERVERAVWTMQRAQRLKLTGKDNWQKQPQAMLLARATSECARLVAADAILGVPYAAEEIEDAAAGADPSPVQEDRPRRTARRALPPPEPTTPEPDVDGETAPDPRPGEDSNGAEWPEVRQPGSAS